CAGVGAGRGCYVGGWGVAWVSLGSVVLVRRAGVVCGAWGSRSGAQMGCGCVHCERVVILSMGLGLFAPPFGVGYYAACAIGRVAPEAGIRPILGYLGSMAVGIVVIAAVPWISTGFLK
ncbi:TRAP transporter large permease subunit, partial [Achromobacter ruhlandii]|uniref:TRAP transporter large permease subunit n=1 Tax=Achromobacter ruhlandii TaxID=72557 RepID=UPI0020166C30